MTSKIVSRTVHDQKHAVQSHAKEVLDLTWCIITGYRWNKILYLVKTKVKMLNI